MQNNQKQNEIRTKYNTKLTSCTSQSNSEMKWTKQNKQKKIGQTKINKKNTKCKTIKNKTKQNKIKHKTHSLHITKQQ